MSPPTPGRAQTEPSQSAVPESVGQEPAWVPLVVPLSHTDAIGVCLYVQKSPAVTVEAWSVTKRLDMQTPNPSVLGSNPSSMTSGMRKLEQASHSVTQPLCVLIPHLQIRLIIVSYPKHYCEAILKWF